MNNDMQKMFVSADEFRIDKVFVTDVQTLEIYFFTDDVFGPFLYLVKYTSYIFPQDPNGKKLDAPKENDNY